MITLRNRLQLNSEWTDRSGLPADNFVKISLKSMIWSQIWNILHGNEWRLGLLSLERSISEQCNFPQCKRWTHAGYVWDSRVLLFSSLTPCLLVKIQYSNEMGCDPNGLWADTAAGALSICGLGCGFRWSDCSKQERQVAYGTGSSYCVVAVWLWTFPLINNPVSLGAL